MKNKKRIEILLSILIYVCIPLIFTFIAYNIINVMFPGVVWTISSIVRLFSTIVVLTIGALFLILVKSSK